MIQALINGENKHLEDKTSLEDLILSFKIPKSSAIAVNDQVIPQSEFKTYQIKNNDHIEIVHPVAGG